MPKTHIAKIAGVAAAIPVLMTATAGSASAAAGSDHLSRGESLYAGQSITRLDNSGTHQLILTMQSDGNLVEYVASDPTGDYPLEACWASGTNGSGATHADYQSDGNFVVYTPSGSPVWASNTQWGSGSTVDINWLGKVFVGTKQISDTCTYNLPNN